ncbi:hypothetical protein AB0M89_13285 [Streptomyces microflavus]|uniref:hypothetical protein n=1 Tax=Streptomyces microflavus TaxID=1919 RepID=UPI0034330822
MTTQSDPVHHLLDRLLRGVILPEEAEQLAKLVAELEQREATLTHMVTVAAQQIDALGTTLRATL